MRIRSFRIPKAVVIPGLVVQVRQVSDVEADGDCGWWEYDEDGTAIIYINNSYTMPVRRYTLYHELQHVMTDLIDQGIERFPDVIQTKRMARELKARRENEG
jgi:Zn-dependent peptidase ImmA (M78 family)